MSADRYYVAAGNTGKYDQDAVVIDRVTGCVVERFPGDGGMPPNALGASLPS